MFLLIGVIVGVLLGLTGAGGSVFAVPLLLLLTPISVSNAMGSALAAVCVGAIYGVLRNWHKQLFLYAPTVILAMGGALTAPFGRWASSKMSEPLLLSIFVFTAGSIAIWMWLNANKRPDDTKVLRGENHHLGTPQQALCAFSPSGQFQLRFSCVSGLVGFSLIIGFMSGLLGVGGGFMIVPVLLLISQASMVQAVSSSLFIISFVSGVGFLSHISLNPVTEWSNLLWMLGGSVLGMMGSGWIGQKTKGPLLQKLFSVALLLISMITLMRRLV